ncbi:MULTISPECIES: hypothetical protein [unclassified Bradyrhizobium]|uniref:hypothetical protein n=1 Tax=unclassified Bradyrhizobium TaxID=2631580 RepID=UPI002916C43D|nr:MULTISPECIES: hypothetical protein [unclassified Bradyrhizobium]
MSKTLDRPLAPIFSACREYYLTNRGGLKFGKSTIFRELKEALTATLQAMASLHAVTYRDYRADKEHAGYLIKFAPPMIFRVPYHVLPTFPTGRELDALWNLSRIVRSSSNSTISISGSNVLRKLFDVVGDVDFCEYLPARDIGDVSKLRSNMLGTQQIVCLTLTLGCERWRYPWDENSPTEEYFARTIDPRNKDRSFIKADYLGEIDEIGVSEISNLIIAIDENGNSASKSRTFAAQEAPLVPIDRLPNQMNDPAELGRYIDWLSSTIRSHAAEGDMRKCLKRCASLSRILFLPDVTDEISELASGNAILLSYKLRNLQHLYSELRSLSDERLQRLCNRISEQITTTQETIRIRGAPDEVSRKRFNDQARAMMVRLLSHLEPDLYPSSGRVA